MLNCLEYPFNHNFIQRKKRVIKRSLLQRPHFIEKKVAILGGSTTFEVKNILELFLLKQGIKPSFYESDYNQYYEEVMFKSQKLEEFSPDIIYIHTGNNNIEHLPSVNDSQKDVENKIQNEFEKFKSIWTNIQNKLNCIIIQNNFAFFLQRELGNLDSVDYRGKNNFILRLNQKFSEFASGEKNFHLNDIHYLSSYFGLENWRDENLWYTSKYILSYQAIPTLAHNISSIIQATMGKAKKCLVLDLDNTLWGGIIGEDGVGGISLGDETPKGEAYIKFQKYIKALKERGVILAVCSKNNHETALEGLNHPDSVLKFKDFMAFKANWELKSQNIKTIAKEINIGADSLVFFDDTPAERALVKEQVPEVSVPDIGSDITKYLSFLDQNLYFEPITLSDDDLKRSHYYQSNKEREKTQSTFKNYDDFLSSLKMEAEIETFSSLYFDRITQLINKTNQFNLTTKRYNLSEVQNIATAPNYINLYGRLKDKFGDNGLITTLSGKIEEETLHLKLWLMSCRVLKRSMENSLFDKLLEVCKERRIKYIKGYYIKSPKNKIVSKHYEQLGFSLESIDENENSVWVYHMNKKHKKNGLIEIIRGNHDRENSRNL